MSNSQIPFDIRFGHLPPPPVPAGWSPPAPPSPHGYAAPPPQRDKRRVELDIRNLLLALGVLSLVAAATSFIAMNWDAFDASMRAAFLVGATVLALFSALAADRRGLSGTRVALSWLTMVLLWVDVTAAERTLPATADLGTFWAYGGAVLFALFVLVGMALPGWAMRTGAVLAWWTAWWAAFEVWGVTGVDVWVLPVAAVVAWFQVRSAVGRPEVSSWNHYGAALAFAAVPAVLTALADPGLIRPLLVVSIAMVVLGAGLVLRQLAAIWIAGVSLGVIASVQIFDALRGMPGWVVFAIVGVVLLAVGAGFERQLHRDEPTSSTPDADLTGGAPTAQTWSGPVVDTPGAF